MSFTKAVAGGCSKEEETFSRYSEKINELYITMCNFNQVLKKFLRNHFLTVEIYQNPLGILKDLLRCLIMIKISLQVTKSC